MGEARRWFIGKCISKLIENALATYYWQHKSVPKFTWRKTVRSSSSSRLWSGFEVIQMEISLIRTHTVCTDNFNIIRTHNSFAIRPLIRSCHSPVRLNWEACRSWWCWRACDQMRRIPAHRADLWGAMYRRWVAWRRTGWTECSCKPLHILSFRIEWRRRGEKVMSRRREEVRGMSKQLVPEVTNRTELHNNTRLIS